MNRFVEAHDRYLALDAVRTDCANQREREMMQIAIMRAYLEVQYHAQEIAGLQLADGNNSVDVN